MKKLFSFMAIALIGAMSLVSCSDDDGYVVVQQYYVVNFEEDYFSNLVDNPQYNGPLIYSANEYKWTDTETQLTSEVVKSDWSAWGMGYGWDHGFAVSNYVDNSTTASFNEQLAVPVSNNSKNFIVCYGDGSELSFADGKARVVEQMSISPTTYLLNNMNSMKGTGYYVDVVMSITKSNGSVVEKKLRIADGTDVLAKWSNVVLSQYGAIKKIVFSFEGSDSGDWGLNTPKYIAIDNIVIDK